MPDLTREDMDQLLTKQAKTFASLVRTGGTSGPTSSSDSFSASSGRFSKEMTDSADHLNKLTTGFDMLGSVGQSVFKAFKEVYNATNENIGMMQHLSKSGMSFSSDVVGMTASIKGMRLSNEEFADVMTKNAAGFTALGGNATRGAEAFAKLSRDFMHSEFIDSLNTMGYTNKELNDLLALQVTTGKMALRDDEASRKQAIRSANELAKEMDATAKLTGKSREEQMSAQQKLRDDMALEAKLRQQTQGMTDEQAAEYRKKVMQQMAQAELEGRGQLLKEQFIHGQAVSEQAVMQQMTSGDAAYAATVKQGDLLRAKQVEQADAQGKEARRAAAAFGDTAEGIFLATLPGNEAITKSAHETMKASQPLRDALAALRQEAEFKGKTDKELEAEAMRRIKEAQDGKNKEGEEVKSTTETMIKLKNRAGDVESAFYNNLVVPLNKDIAQSMRTLNRDFLGGQLRRSGQPTISYEEGVGRGMGTAYRRDRDKPQNLVGLQADDYETQTKLMIKKDFDSMGMRLNDVHKEALFAAGRVFNQAGEGVNTGVKKIETTSAQSRSTGSLGMTGKLIEDFGQGTMMTLHGRESVMTEQQLMELVSGMKQSNVADVVNNLTSSVKKVSSGDSMSDMMNRMNYTVSSNAQRGAINLEMPSSLKDMKVNPDEMSKSVHTMMSQMQRYSDSIASDTGRDKQAKTKNEDFISTFSENKATLDDVVTSLNNLNIKMAQLLETNIDIGSKQIRAVQSNSRNLFERF